MIGITPMRRPSAVLRYGESASPTRSLPETIALTGKLSKVIDLGEGRQINLGSQIP